MSLILRLLLRYCGEQPDKTVTETSTTNTMSVEFASDSSYVDRGFEAEYEAIDSNDREWLSFSKVMSFSRILRRCISREPSRPQLVQTSSSAQISAVSDQRSGVMAGMIVETWAMS